ncbi:hypothetical protein ILYODFUR_005023 [Ilyodon furcidens]|uniref:Uncharacterized protein n=1 Tax=Ilyodon furcidens TaxID=33524 RepID=A0ABV0UES6_9TELE
MFTTGFGGFDQKDLQHCYSLYTLHTLQKKKHKELLIVCAGFLGGSLVHFNMADAECRFWKLGICTLNSRLCCLLIKSVLLTCMKPRPSGDGISFICAMQTFAVMKRDFQVSLFRFQFLFVYVC